MARRHPPPLCLSVPLLPSSHRHRLHLDGPARHHRPRLLLIVRLSVLTEQRDSRQLPTEPRTTATPQPAKVSLIRAYVHVYTYDADARLRFTCPGRRSWPARRSSTSRGMDIAVERSISDMVSLLSLKASLSNVATQHPVSNTIAGSTSTRPRTPRSGSLRMRRHLPVPMQDTLMLAPPPLRARRTLSSKMRLRKMLISRQDCRLRRTLGMGALSRPLSSSLTTTQLPLLTRTMLR